MFISICEQKCWNLKNSWWGCIVSIFTNPKTIPTIPLNGSKEHSLDYYLHMVCMVYYFLYVPNIATALLKNFQAKTLYFQSQFSQFDITLYVIILLIILRRLGTFRWVWYDTHRPNIYPKKKWACSDGYC